MAIIVAFPKPKREDNPRVLEHVRNQRCLVCDRWGCDPDHITTRGAGGGDTGDNVWPLCREHHTQRHSMGIESFIRTYKQLQDWLRYHERWDILAPIMNEQLSKTPKKKKRGRACR